MCDTENTGIPGVVQHLVNVVGGNNINHQHHQQHHRNGSASGGIGVSGNSAAAVIVGVGVNPSLLVGSISGQTVEDLSNENYWLREKLKEITVDRDRLLCEVANLRLELDMGELKRMPEDSFPQKVADRPSPAYAIQGNSGGYVYMQQQQHYQPPPPQQLVYQHQLCHQIHPGHQTAVQTLHKKGSIRSGGDVLKRARTQNAYELSQDLLDKQIELLERKYGGVKARHAAITIQRAFRHYTMVKKFASITAMAKAEKRLSRRLPAQQQQHQDVQYIDDQSTSAYGSASGGDQELVNNNSINIISNNNSTSTPQRVCATITATPAGVRMTPVRSMSLRERRSLDVSPNQRSQSGQSSPMPPSSCWQQQQSIGGVGHQQLQLQQLQPLHSHPHVNLLHAEQHYYSTPTPQQYHQQQYQPPATHQIQQYCLQDLSMNASSQLDSTASSHSMNSSWNSHQQSPSIQPYYSAAQIYMRPRTSTQLVTASSLGNAATTCSSTSSINSISSSKRVPPEVPKRTSSITSQRGERGERHHSNSSNEHTPNRALRPNGLCKTSENGSLSSVQSSGSDSSADRIHCDVGSDRSTSPQWKRKGGGSGSSGGGGGILITAQSPDHHLHHHNLHHSNNGNNNSSNHNHHLQHMNSCSGSTSTTTTTTADNDCMNMNSHTSAAQYSLDQHHHDQLNTPTNFKISETVRKRQYRVGLNLFNKKSEKGILYLIGRGFLENTPQGVARFLISRKGLSRQMIGEYLGNLQNQFNMAVLECFAGELDLSGMQVDVALRKFQAYFRMPGEAQKIERLMEIFSQRYCQCNSDIVARLRSSDTVFVMAFAIIMLNTDLHTPNLKPERRMRVDDFIKNLRGIDDCHDIDRDMLAGIYERLKANEFKPGSDHVTQVMKVQATIVGKKPNLALPHRRLVCYCRLYEIPDINKKERPGVHQREVFLFNDLLVITKIFSKKKSSVTYTFRNSFPLCGMVVTLLDVPNYPYCIRLSQKVDGKALVTFNARNEHDRCKFAEDLRESISEMDEMEALRIEAELEKQKSARGNRSGNSENRDSGVADVEVCPCPYQSSPQNEVQHEAQLKRSALSNSLLDMHEQFGATEKSQRRGSVGSLDSGMSISFQSTSASTGSRSDTKARLMQHGAIIGQHPGFLGGIFNKRERKLSKSEESGGGGSGTNGPYGRSTEV